MNDKNPNYLEIFQYSFLALPLAFAGLPLYIHAPDFYTRDLGMSIGLIGGILLAIRLFDAVQDPVIGYISDKHASKRYQIVLFGVLMLSAGMMGIFYGPHFGIHIALWFAISMLLATTGFSVLTINLNMIGGLWHDNPDQRTRISAWREAFTLVGVLIAAILPAALQHFRPAEETFKIIFWIFGGLIVVSFFLFTRFMRRISTGHLVTSTSTKKGLSFLPILVGPDREFFAVCFFTHLAAAMPGVMVLFFIEDYLQAGDLSGVFLFLYFIAGAALMSLWVQLSKKIGKEETWLVSMVLAVVTFIGAYFLQPGDVIAYGIICVLSGLALGADLALPPSIIADRVTKQKAEGEATQYYALLAFIPKVAIAIASGISFLILERLGFEAGTNNSSQVLDGLIILYALVPCVIKLFAAGLLWHFLKRKGDKDENMEERSTSHGTANIS